MVVIAQTIVKIIVRIIAKVAAEKVRQPRGRNPFRIGQFNSLPTCSVTTIYQCLAIFSSRSIKRWAIFVFRQLFCSWQTKSIETAQIIHI